MASKVFEGIFYLVDFFFKEIHLHYHFLGVGEKVSRTWKNNYFLEEI